MGSKLLGREYAGEIHREKNASILSKIFLKQVIERLIFTVKLTQLYQLKFNKKSNSKCDMF